MYTDLNDLQTFPSHEDLNDTLLRARRARDQEVARWIKAGVARLRHSLHIAPTPARTA